MNEVWDVVIVGGGAAGFFAAVTCAERWRRKGRILIVERAPRVLQKVRISGGGRCNVTHDCRDPKRMASRYPRGNKALIGPLHHFGVDDTLQWFESRGVSLKTEADGRIFPTSDDSKTIVDCLRTAATSAGVELRTGTAVETIEPPARKDGKGGSGPFFELVLRGGSTIRSSKILVATGGTRLGSSRALAQSLGHRLKSAVPSLFTFQIDDPLLHGLQGLSVPKVELSVCDEKLVSSGPLLVTHWGLSGPAVLELSAWGARKLHSLNYHFILAIDWLPGVDLEKRFHDLRSGWGARQIGAHCPFEEIPGRLWKGLVRRAKIDATCRWAEFSVDDGRTLSAQLSETHLSVTGQSTYRDEFVTCGGIPTDEVDMRTMESRITPGAFVAGEVLDIDGITGGYNFQNAWTTGYLAGRAMAE